MKPASLLAPIAALVCGVHVFAAEALPTRPLFNGKDFSGWRGVGYVVEDGAIISTPKGHNLVTEETFSNFVLDFEFQLTPDANSGLGIHYPGNGNGAFAGMEIQILDDTAPKFKDLKVAQFHGSLYAIAAARQGFLKPVGEWNQERVTVMGTALKVELNGEIILRVNLDEMSAKFPKHEGLKRRAGHIAWLGHGDRVAFRNINISELPPAADEDGVKAGGFTKIFDGNTLNGWKHTPDITHWKAIQGILKHDGKPGPTKDMWTEKSYGDFTLVCDWRWSGRGPKKTQPKVMPDGSTNGTVEIEEFDNGIYLRGNTKSQVKLWNWPIGSGEVYGYRTDANMPPEIKAGVTPKANADKPIGEWNRTMVTLKGDRLTVSLNGKLVIDNAQLPGVPASGPIGLQHHGSAIDFANLWIKEL